MTGNHVAPDDLREALIEAIGLDQGWEESAVHMVDNVVLPVARRHLAAPPQEIPMAAAK